MAKWWSLNHSWILLMIALDGWELMQVRICHGWELMGENWYGWKYATGENRWVGMDEGELIRVRICHGWEKMSENGPQILYASLELIFEQAPRWDSALPQ